VSCLRSGKDMWLYCRECCDNAYGHARALISLLDDPMKEKEAQLQVFHEQMMKIRQSKKTKLR